MKEALKTEARALDFQSVKIIWKLLFEGLEFENDEYVEIAYDDFKKAMHVRTSGDFIGVARRFSGISNLSVSSCTKKVKEKGKRTGKDAIYRQKCIILDIDNPNGHQRLSEEEGLELANRVIEEIKKKLGNDFGLRAIGYTGGGVQLYIALDRVLKGKEEIERIYGLLKECLGDIKLIDTASFTPSQLQRLLGTYNLKYTPRALSKFLKVFENVKPLSMEVLEMIASQKVISQRGKPEEGNLPLKRGEINPPNSIIKNIDEVKREIEPV